jgi:hypothetical protein
VSELRTQCTTTAAKQIANHMHNPAGNEVAGTKAVRRAADEAVWLAFPLTTQVPYVVLLEPKPNEFRVSVRLCLHPLSFHSLFVGLVGFVCFFVLLVGWLGLCLFVW